MLTVEPTNFDQARIVSLLNDFSAQFKLGLEDLLKKQIDFQPRGMSSVLACPEDEKIIINSDLLKLIYQEGLLESQNKQDAENGLALRLLLIIVHERAHLLEHQQQKKDLGFYWPLSSLQAEVEGVRTEAELYGRIILDPKLRLIFERTSPPRNYIIPGSFSSITESFDRRISGAFSVFQSKNDERLLEFCRQYYPNAIDLLNVKRSDLEIQLKAIQKVELAPHDAQNLNQALQICESVSKFDSLLRWYAKRRIT